MVASHFENGCKRGYLLGQIDVISLAELTRLHKKKDIAAVVHFVCTCIDL